MSSVDFLSIGVSGLNAASAALSSASHNIANANNEDYSRQQVTLGARNPLLQGSGFVGQGVSVTSVRRFFDQFLADEVRTNTSSYNYNSQFRDFTSRLDILLGDPNTGVTTAMQEFYGAMHTVADDPTSIPAREVLLSKSDILVNRFDTLYSQFESMRDVLNQELVATTGAISQIGGNIADLNADIMTLSSAGTGASPNDLLDQRDSLIKELAELVDISTVEQNDASISVFIGNGQPLVLGVRSETIGTQSSLTDVQALEVNISTSTASVEISQFVNGGKLGALLDFRSNALEAAFNALGHTAVGLAGSVNDQHQLGMDLNNRLGGLFFTDVNSAIARSNRAIAQTDNTGTADFNINIDDVSALTGSDYRMNYTLATTTYTLTRLSDNTVVSTFVEPTTLPVQTSAANTGTAAVSISIDDNTLLTGSDYSLSYDSGAGNYTLTRTSDNTVISTFAEPGAPGPVAIAAEGFTINFTAVGAADGDTFTIQQAQQAIASEGFTINFDDFAAGNNDVFMIRPTRFGANELAMTVDEPDEIAAAYPIRTTFASTNTGTGSISAGVVTDTTNPAFATGGALTPPLQIVFDDPATTFDVINMDTSAVIAADVAFTAGQSNDVLTLAGLDYGYTFTISGTPAAGDTFNVAYNTGGVGDNRNIVEMTGQQTAKLLNGGTSTLQDVYGILVAGIGTQSNEAAINERAAESLLRRAEEKLSSLKGVNLDEEAADLIKFERAFQANSRVISAANTIFQSLLRAVGG